MLNGDSVISRVKAKHKCPIVAVTANADISVKRKAHRFGMKLVLNKPVEMEQIKHVL